MERIGFPQYTSSLLEYGWDDLEFLSDLTEEDLTEVGVPREHQRIVRLHATQYSGACMRMYYHAKMCFKLFIFGSLIFDSGASSLKGG